MQSPKEFADQIFDVLSFSIDLACHEKEWFNVSRDALAFGFTQTDVSSDFAYAQRFDLEVSPEIFISLHYRSFDPSGPFRKLPGVSKFELTMSIQQKMERFHQNSFDEPLPANDPATWDELSYA